MCARHEFDSGVRDVALAVSATHNPEVLNLAEGDIRPADPSLVMAGHKGRIHAGIMTWGLPRYDGKGLIINTRSETALEKPMFRENTLRRRCIIPARAFYEWDAEKRMVTFFLPDQQIIWMAGIFDPEHRYSVLTTAANDSVSGFHDRMPVLLPQDAMDAWLFDASAAGELMKQKMPALEHRQDFEQLSFF